LENPTFGGAFSLFVLLGGGVFFFGLSVFGLVCLFVFCFFFFCVLGVFFFFFLFGWGGFGFWGGFFWLGDLLLPQKECPAGLSKSSLIDGVWP